MDIFKEYQQLKTQTEFKKFQRDEKDYYLVHLVVPEEEQNMEFGFYNPKKDKITVFQTNPFSQGKEEDVFKEGKTIKPLEFNKVKINYNEAKTQTDKILKTEFSEEKTKKKIIILQHINEPVWNITTICESLNIINIRINAETGKLVRKDKSSLLNMAKVDK